MQTTFNLADIWARGDFVSHCVAVILLIMSVMSWVLILYGVIRHVRLRRQQAAVRSFWKADGIDAGISALPDPASPWRQLALQGREAVEGYRSGAGVGSINDKAEWIIQTLGVTLDRTASRFSKGLATLSSIGATAPFIGLLGTVWGIYHTLLSLSGGGMMTIDQVAGPIGEALVMTAFGLFVAIPAVLGNNAIAAINRHWLEQLGLFAQELDTYLLTGRRPLGAGERE